jgi:hypothetical protein
LANPYGRPVGSRNKRDLELLDRLEKRGDRLAIDILSEIANDEKEAKPLRIQAAIGAAPYQTHKLGLAPAAPLLNFIETPVELPHPHVTTLMQVVENIEHVSQLRRSGALDQDTADRLVGEQRVVRDAIAEAAKLEAEHGTKDQTIQILGGLPPLPGTHIEMPELSGLNGHPTIDGLPTPVPPVPPDPKSDAT